MKCENTYTTGVSEEVRTDWLNAALSGSRESTNGLEILLSGPTLREDRKWQSNLRVRLGNHCGGFEVDLAEELR